MGDKNTKFFHTYAKMKKKHTTVNMLKDGDGNWFFDDDKLQDMAINYFSKLYDAKPTDIMGTLPSIHKFPILEDDVLRDIQAPPLNSKIREAMFSMGGLKAPGPDGLHALFFQSQLEIIGDSVCDFVRKVFDDPSRIAEVNETMLILIPKIDNTENIKKFHPISLCNVIYKIAGRSTTCRLQVGPPLFNPFFPRFPCTICSLLFFLSAYVMILIKLARLLFGVLPLLALVLP